MSANHKPFADNWPTYPESPTSRYPAYIVNGTDVMRVDPPVPGRKDDTGKLDMTLLDDLPHALEAVAEVLQWAITKKAPVPYVRGSWQGVDDGTRRYLAALQRHMSNRNKARLADLPEGEVRGLEPVDHETKLRELAHIATDALFALELAIRNDNKIMAQIEKDRSPA